MQVFNRMGLAARLSRANPSTARYFATGFREESDTFGPL